MTPLNNLPGTSPLTRSVCHVPPPSTAPLFLRYVPSPSAALPFLVQWIKMNLDEIENRINSIFSEDYNRQIIFWYDENQEFIEDIENIQLNNAKLYVLKENNLIKT